MNSQAKNIINWKLLLQSIQHADVRMLARSISLIENEVDGYIQLLQMLSDNPTTYMKEQESTDFISAVPTTFDETIAVDGKVGEYVAIARRKGTTWYAGAMSNWDARQINVDRSFLPAGTGRRTPWER